MKTTPQKDTITKKGNSITQVIGTYLPYWPLFIIFLLLSLGVAFAYLSYAVPKYEASATIIIKDEKKGDDDSKFMESLDLINTKKIIENEIEVLQSRTLMDAVVRKLHLYAPIYGETNIKSIAAYELSPLMIEAQNPDLLKESKRIDLDYNPSNNKILLNKTQEVVLGKWFNTPYGTLRFLKNDTYLPGSVLPKSLYFSVSPTKNATAAILGGLKVLASSKLSSVIDLSYRDEVPRRAEDILNELIASYSDAALKDKNTLAKNTLTFLESRLNIVSKDLDSIESKLQKYKAGKGAVDISKQGQLYLDNISSNDKRMTDINMQLSVMNQMAKAAASPSSEGMLSSSMGITDPSLIEQMNSLRLLQMQYDKLKLTVAENNPVLLSIKEQINRNKTDLLNNIQGQKTALENNKNNLSSVGGGFSTVLSAIPQKERELLEISRDQSIKSGIYQFLLQKREESELSYASTIADSRIVNKAMAGKYPVSPNNIIVYLVALLVGLGLPIAFVTTKDVLSPKILYRNEIESLTTIPVVGEVSFSDEKDELVVAKGKRTVIAEEFRKIRVSLPSLGFNSAHKKILITSSIEGEGKSFIAANLASSLSLTGKKVILVDIDLHNPGLGKFFGIKEQNGISEYLIGKKNIEQIIYRISDNENLFYISSGNLQQDSSELLENGKIKLLIDQLDKEFDVIIIDTAPVVLITDAYLLSSLCDMTLYVTRHKFTPKMLIERMDNNMIINPIKNPGIIFNGVKTRGFFKNNYGYGYNYVYSYDNKNKKSELKSFTGIK